MFDISGIEEESKLKSESAEISSDISGIAAAHANKLNPED